MLRQIFKLNLYVRVYRNRLSVKNVDDNREVSLNASEPFTTKRLLVGEFMKAETLLKQAIKKVVKDKWLRPSPIIVIQPMEMTEEGLSSVEDRLFSELAFGAGGRKVVVWVGKELTNDEVIVKANNA
jgi:hypothetical protein